VELTDLSLLLLREDVGETYNNVVSSAAAAVGAESCGLALYDADTDEMIARKPHYDGPETPVPRYRLEPSPASRRVLETGEPHICNDASSDPLYRRAASEAGVVSILTVPVRRGNRIVGLLYAINRPGGFGAEHARALTALAGAAAVTIENLRLYALERDRRVLSDSLREVSRAIVTTPSEDAAMASVLDHMWRVVRYEAALTVVRDGGRLRVAASRGGDAGLELPLEQAGSLRHALETQRVTRLEDAPTLLPRLGLRGLRGRAVAAPLVARGEALGAFVVAFQPEQAEGDAELPLVHAFADHAALFLDVGAGLRRERAARARAAVVARITRLAVTRHEPESLLQAAAPELLAISGADRVVLYLRHVRNPVLVPIADAGTAPGEEARVRELRLDYATGPLRPLAVCHPVVLGGEARPPAGVTPHPGSRTIAVLPLVCREELVGAALVASLERPLNLDDAGLELLSDVAHQIALGVENARLFAQLSQLASTDELTGLSNRRRFSEALRMEMARVRRLAQPLSLVMLDVDHLKRINDSHGHPAGDAAIRHVADALRRGRRETDISARLGGEEFAILMPGSEREGAMRAAERIRRELAESSIPIVGTVTVSAGVVSAPDEASDEEALLRLADERLYAAKAGGRNRVCGLGVAPDAPPHAAAAQQPDAASLEP
jgi:diguanylate cyclase (GGDEF)-like protein